MLNHFPIIGKHLHFCRVNRTLKIQLRIPLVVLPLLVVLQCFGWVGVSKSENITNAFPQTLSLEQAITYGLEHNRSLQNSRLGLSSSEVNVQTAEAGFDLKVVPVGRLGFSSDDANSWQVGAALSKKFSIGADVSVSPYVSESFDNTSTDVAFSLNVPLLQGAGKEFAMSAVFSSRYAYETSKLSFFTQQINIILQTVNSVYASIRTSLQIQLLEKQLRMLEGHLALAKIKERSGIISAIDLYRAEIRLNDVQNELTSINEQHADNIDSVKDVLGIPQSGQVTVTAPLEYKPVSIDLKEALVIAQENRIEIEKSQRAELEQKRLLRIAKNNLLPQLDMRLGYNLIGGQVFEDLKEDSWTLTFESDTNLFRTVEQNAYRQQKIELRQSQLSLESSMENINQQVRSELNSLEKQKKRIEVRKQQVNQTIGKLKLAQSKFQYGMTDNFVLIEAQTELQEAQTTHLFERINYITGMYSLRATLGTLLQRPPD